LREGLLQARVARVFNPADFPRQFASGGNRRGTLKRRLLAQLKLFGDGLVAVQVFGVKIIQQPSALANHHQQTTAGAMVLLVFLKVLGQVVDALGEQRDLHIRRTGIPFMQFEIAYRLYLCIHTYQLN
jgi:hypothetical protein